MTANMNAVQKTARTAGFLHLLLIPLSVVGVLYVPAALIGPSDVAAMASKILANEGLFRLSIASALLVQLVNLAVVLLLYQLLQPMSRPAARLMVTFLVLGIPIAMLNELNQAAVLLLVKSADPAPALVALFLNMHKYGILTAQIFWGLWLFPMGYLVFKSNYIPRVIGILLVIAGVGYLADSATFFLDPDLQVAVSQFTFIGEAVLPVWLVVKGVNVEQWKKRALHAPAIEQEGRGFPAAEPVGAQ
jgi:hypothetical protein